jgi:excisionase family DNA binding protein
LAALWNVSTKSISRRIKSHELRAHRVGRSVRIAEEDAHAFMAARRR